MVLGIYNSYEKFMAADAIKAGKYSNIRMWGGYRYPLGGDEPAYATTANDMSQLGFKWFNSSDAVAWSEVPCPKEGGCPFPPYSVWDDTSAACFYFAQGLTDIRGEAVPIGLIQSDMGGTTVESWSPNATLDSCTNWEAGSSGSAPTKLYYGMITPFVNTTIAGFLWCK